MSKNNFEERPKITNFDFLLGFFVILAMDEHFTYYLNWWYVEFFKEIPALKGLYHIHLSMLGKGLETDQFNAILGNIFIPWVSQVYLALTSFKLAGKDSKVLRENLKSRLKIYGIIILTFIFENFLVAPDFGQAISIYPIIMWMVILTLLSIVYAHFDIKGIVILTLISFLRWVIPIDFWSDVFQVMMINNVHPSFEYDARIEYFLTSGCLGFLLGYVYYYKENVKQKFFIVTSLAGLLAIILFFLAGGSFYSNPSDSLSNEHDLAKTFIGSLYIWGAITTMISIIALLEIKRVKIRLPIINWVGENSLTVFGTHRVFFLKIIMPISMFVSAMSGRVISASTFEIYFYILCSIALSWLVYKLRLYRIIFPQKL